MRLVAGGAATAVTLSFWLLAFSMFLFMSLAIVKRYTELLVTMEQNKESARGRGYRVHDLPVLMALGASAGMSAVLVLSRSISMGRTPSAYIRIRAGYGPCRQYCSTGFAGCG